MAKKKTKTKNSSKTIWVVVGVVVVVLLGFFIFNKGVFKQSSTPSESTQPTSFNFGNQTFSLNDEQLTFVNGSYSSNDPDTGDETATIMNRTLSPSSELAAAVLVDNPGGSGTFYYVVGGMMKDGSEVYSDPVLLGDRIKIVSVTVEDPEAHDNGEIVVEYLDRAENAPMSSEPTVQMTKKFSFDDNGELIEALH